MVTSPQTGDQNVSKCESNFDCIGHTWWTLAYSSVRIAFAVILTFALLFAFLPVFPVWTCLCTQWSREAGGAPTFTRNVMACTIVLATARFRTIQPVLTIRTLQFAFVTRIAFRACTEAVKLIANAVILALARM